MAKVSFHSFHFDGPSSGLKTPLMVFVKNIRGENSKGTVISHTLNSPKHQITPPEPPEHGLTWRNFNEAYESTRFVNTAEFNKIIKSYKVLKMLNKPNIKLILQLMMDNNGQATSMQIAKKTKNNGISDKWWSSITSSLNRNVYETLGFNVATRGNALKPRLIRFHGITRQWTLSPHLIDYLKG